MKPLASAAMLGVLKLPTLLAFTTCSPPTLAPAASNSWSLTPPTITPLTTAAGACQIAAKPPPGRPARFEAL